MNDSKWVEIICIEQSSKYRTQLSDSKDGPEPSSQPRKFELQRGINHEVVNGNRVQMRS